MSSAEGEPVSIAFDLNQVAGSFPEHAETMLLDRYLVDRSESSTRIFRVYSATPAHFHQHCDEHLLVLSGRGTYWVEHEGNGGEFAPGSFLFFRRGTPHAMPELLDHPVVFLAIDTPRRDPGDIIFLDEGAGTPETFIAPAS